LRESKTLAEVRFGSDSGLKSDIASRPKSASNGSRVLFDHFVGTGEQRWRDLDA
jgi:hypothetical protein